MISPLAEKPCPSRPDRASPLSLFHLALLRVYYEILSHEGRLRRKHAAAQNALRGEAGSAGL